jgi:hypothetical protein
MKTKLEMMVGYLAGRRGPNAELIRQELQDPTSEASLWLAAVRSRSREVLSMDLREKPDLLTSASISGVKIAFVAARKWLLPFVLGASAAAIAFISVGAARWVQDDRLTHLESILANRDAQVSDRFNRLEAAVIRRQEPLPAHSARPQEPISQEGSPKAPANATTDLLLARIEARLGELGQRLLEGQTKEATASQSVDQLRPDLEQLRRQVEAGSRANKQGIHELSTIVREVLQLLRQLAIQAQTQELMQTPVPVPIPPQGQVPLPGRGLKPGNFHGPGRLPGVDPMSIGDSPMNAGPQSQQRGPQSFPGGHGRPGMQTHGGPG